MDARPSLWGPVVAGLLLLTQLGMAQVATAEIETADGDRLSGQTLSLRGEGGVALDGHVHALRDLASFRMLGGDIATTRLAAVLVDGGWLPLEGLSGEANDRLRLRQVGGDLVLPLGVLIGWGSPADLDRLRPVDGQDLVLIGEASDPVRVTVLGAGPDGVAVDGSLGQLTLPWARIRALRLGVATRSHEGLLLAAPLVPGRPPALLRQRGEQLVLAADDSVSLASLPRGEIVIRGGRRVALADLEPSAVEEIGLFGVVWPHRRNQDLDGRPIELGGSRALTGLVVHSEARLRWRLPEGSRRLRLRLGIVDALRPEGDCLVTLRGDGRSLWSGRVSGRDDPQSLDLDLSGVRELEVEILPGERYDIGDHVALADAWIVRDR